MHELQLQIVRFVDDGFPGWVECELIDAYGNHHMFRDKYPIFTTELPDADSHYPVNGFVRCEILDRYRDENGQELVRINTRSPWSVESQDGTSEFVVRANSVTSTPG